MSQTLKLNVTFPIPADSIVAVDEIATAIAEYRTCRARMSLLEKAAAIHRAVVEEFLGDKLVLLNTDGTELCTWKYSKDGVTLSVEELKKNFPEIYELCLVEKKGVRSFK